MNIRANNNDGALGAGPWGALLLLCLAQASCTPAHNPESTAPVACTMDAKQCADGSYVGRVPPNCEFAPCPGGEGKVDR